MEVRVPGVRKLRKRTERVNLLSTVTQVMSQCTNHLLSLFNISHFSSTTCSEVMSKRTQKDSGEERVTAKSKPMMNLVSRCSERTPVVLPSTASESLEKTRKESQSPLSMQADRCDTTGETRCLP